MFFHSDTQFTQAYMYVKHLSGDKKGINSTFRFIWNHPDAETNNSPPINVHDNHIEKFHIESLSY